MEKHRKIALEDNYHLIENEDDITTKSEIDILKIEHGEKEKPVKRSVKVSVMEVDMYHQEMQRCGQIISLGGGGFLETFSRI